MSVTLPIGQIDRAYLVIKSERGAYYVGVANQYPDSPMFVEIPPPRTGLIGEFEIVPLVPPEQVDRKHLRPATVKFSLPPVEPKELGSVELKSGLWQIELQGGITIINLTSNVAIKSPGNLLLRGFVTPPLNIDKETEGEWIILAGGDERKHCWLCFPPLGYWLLVSKRQPTEQQTRLR